MKEKGYFQIYTGNGKGKTTASFGLALRAVGAGYKTYIGQFVKHNTLYSEIKSINNRLPEITIEQYGTDKGYLIERDKEDDDYSASEVGYEKIKTAMLSGKYDIIIADEINISLHLGLLKIDKAIELVKQKPENVELIFTGRYAKDELIELADLVSVIEDRKHYYNDGVVARVGIEK